MAYELVLCQDAGEGAEALLVAAIGVAVWHECAEWRARTCGSDPGMHRMERAGARAEVEHKLGRPNLEPAAEKCRHEPGGNSEMSE